MERLANVVTIDLYNSEKNGLYLIDESVVKRKGRPRELINFVEDADELFKSDLLIQTAYQIDEISSNWQERDSSTVYWCLL